MTLARLLAAALLLCSLPALAQDQQSQHSRTPKPPCRGLCLVNVMPSKVSFFSVDWVGYSGHSFGPLGDFPESADRGSTRSALDQVRLGQYDFGQLIQDPKEGKDDSGLYPLPPRHRSVTLIGPDVQLPDDNTCLTMRSYVVARDSKDSDSTHLVSYTTCQPSARYRVKTTEMRVVTVDR